MSDTIRHQVTATMIVAKVPGAQGGETYLRQGQFLPSNVSKTETERLLDRGLIAAVPTATELEALVAAEQAEQAAREQAAFDEKVTEAAKALVASQKDELDEAIERETEKRVEARLAEERRSTEDAAAAATPQTPATKTRDARKSTPTATQA
jgi:hypothetical protein